jgi:hypothetical protein
VGRKDVEDLRKLLNLPTYGPIDFLKYFGMSYSEYIRVLQQEYHLILTREMHRQITFDEVAWDVIAKGRRMIIDDFYKVSHGVELRPYYHDWDDDKQQHTFIEMPAKSHDQAGGTKWFDPHVFAMADACYTPQYNFSISYPNTVNVGYEIGNNYDSTLQLFTANHALKVSFKNSASVVSIDTDYRIAFENLGQPIYNWQLLLAYDKNDNLLDTSGFNLAGGGGGTGTLTVSDWAGNISYVMITVDKKDPGLKPYAIFDNIRWTAIETFLITVARKLFPQDPPHTQQSNENKMIQKKVQNILQGFRQSEKRRALKTEAQEQ